MGRLSRGRPLPAVLLCGLCGLCGAALNFTYHGQAELEGFLRAVTREHPALTHLHSIGKSAAGRNLWVLVLGRFPTKHTVGIPEFKYVANMHGDETVGRELLLHLIDHLVSNDGRDPIITRMLDTTRIHIMPSMNPDGFESITEPDCYYSEGRYNGNSFDLNRNFPDAFENNSDIIQPETRAVMNWMKSESFVLSANLHGGAVVASYPFDNGNEKTGILQGHSLTPDNDVFEYLAYVYASKNSKMQKGNQCKNNKSFNNGITNGYNWYPLQGGMQDYNYIWAQCFEITLELSCCKYPSMKQLPSYWKDNKDSLIEYIKQVHLGVKGQVFDQSKSPIPNVIVEVQGRNHICPYRTNRYGEYYLLLLPGSYVINATIPGHNSMLRKVNISDSPRNFSALKVDFDFPFPMKPASKTTDETFCPEIPLYMNFKSHAEALKPCLLFLFLLTLLTITF
ncbi:carboxypeptidase M isoform X1 [Ornithorhynchus anatinus]|uniref:Carboxypeptidase M n=2 Tax=Ornithorhynchus anatinus TaxID=9258 RepID=F7CJD4_ORNAN|nr:carboxypeptidase M isoform X1 [Ornithorhynchus anatinus]